MSDKENLSTQESPVEDGLRLKLKDEQRRLLTEKVLASWEFSDAARVQWLLDREEGLKLYWGIRKPKEFPFPGCANLHVPLIRTITDTLHSNIMGSLDFEKPAAAIPVGPEDIPKARKQEKLLNWQFTAQVDYHDLSDKAALSALIYGIAPIKLRYVIEKDGNKKTFDGLKADLLPPERFLYPPDSPSMDVDAMEYCIHEIVMSLSDIRKRIAGGKYDDIQKEELDRLGQQMSQSTGDLSDQLRTIRDLYTGQNAEHKAPANSKYLTVIEWYGGFDYNDDGIEEQVMVTLLKESKKILRVSKWKRRRPFVVITVSDVLHKPAGESVPDLLKSINLELNTLHNQRVDAVTITNVPFFFFDPVAGYNPNEVHLTPGVGIPVNGSPSQAVYFPSLVTARPEMYREEELLFLYAERMLGAGANVQGVQQPRRTTATEITEVDRRSGIRFLTIFNRFRRGMKNVFQLALELDRDLMPPEMQVRVTGIESTAPIFETIAREDMQAQVDIVVNGNSVLDEQAEKTEQFQLYQIGMSNPIIARDEIAVYELTRDLFAKLGAKRIDSYLRKPEDTIPRNPNEEHNLFLQEEYIAPHTLEDTNDHLKKHAELINSPQFKLLSKKGQMLLIRHYTETQRMKTVLEQLELIQKANMVNTMLLQSQMGGGQPQIQAGGSGPAGQSMNPMPEMPSGSMGGGNAGR